MVCELWQCGTCCTTLHMCHATHDSDPLNHAAQPRHGQLPPANLPAANLPPNFIHLPPNAQPRHGQLPIIRFLLHYFQDVLVNENICSFGAELAAKRQLSCQNRSAKRLSKYWRATKQRRQHAFKTLASWLSVPKRSITLLEVRTSPQIFFRGLGPEHFGPLYLLLIKCDIKWI